MAYYHDIKEKKARYYFGDEEGSHYRKKDRFHNGTDRKGYKTKGDSISGGKQFGSGPAQRSSNKGQGDNRAKHINEKRNSPKPASFDPERSVSYRDYEYMPARNPNDSESVPQSMTENYILTGRNPIREALKNHRDLEKLLVQKGELSGSAKEIVQRAKEQKVMVQVVEKSRLDEIAPQHQGLIAFASAYQYSTVEEILEAAEEKGETPFIIILDGITDPHNFGAIIRTAECSGAHGVIVPVHRNVGLTPAAVKASAGAVEYIKVARVNNINRIIEELQKKNIWVYALTMNGTDYTNVQFNGGVALVIGAEGDGISRLTEEKCDMAVSLPMKGKVDSLNASVAAGIMMYRVMEIRNK